VGYYISQLSKSGFVFEIERWQLSVVPFYLLVPMGPCHLQRNVKDNTAHLLTG
jgi:hypothetical protein